MILGGAYKLSERKFSFAPVWAEDAKLLILGTMPSVQSLQQGFYYAHPRNAFWPILFELLGEARPDDVATKSGCLIRSRIALWDVAQSAIRPGSLDSAIREAIPNDIPGLLQNCPGIGKGAAYGTTAFSRCTESFCRLWKSNACCFRPPAQPTPCPTRKARRVGGAHSPEGGVMKKFIKNGRPLMRASGILKPSKAKDGPMRRWIKLLLR